MNVRPDRTAGISCDDWFAYKVFDFPRSIETDRTGLELDGPSTLWCAGGPCTWAIYVTARSRWKAGSHACRPNAGERTAKWAQQRSPSKRAQMQVRRAGMTEDESHPRPQSRMTEERNRIKARATTTIRGCLPPVPLGASGPPGDRPAGKAKAS
jgi:hypothetical protein